jgi:DNA-directed RNA polymerase specialized sigma24 family protein
MSIQNVSMGLNEALLLFRSQPTSLQERRRRAYATELLLRELRVFAHRHAGLIQGLHVSGLDDICQDVMVLLYRSNSNSLDNLDSAGNARAYLRTALHNHTKTLFRQQSRVVMLEPELIGKNSTKKEKSFSIATEQSQKRPSRQSYEVLEYEDSEQVEVDISTASFSRSPIQQLEFQQMLSLFSRFCDYVARQSSSRRSTQQKNRQRLQWVFDLQNGFITYEELMTEHCLTRSCLDTQIFRVRQLLWETLDRMKQRLGVEQHLTSEEESFCEHAETLQRWVEWLQSHRSRR